MPDQLDPPGPKSEARSRPSTNFERVHQISFLRKDDEKLLRQAQLREQRGQLVARARGEDLESLQELPEQGTSELTVGFEADYRIYWSFDREYRGR